MSFTMRTLAKEVKQCARNPSISDTDFLNAFYGPYIRAARICKRGSEEEDYQFDKHRASRLLSGDVDVPRAFRKVRLQHGLESRVEEECAILFDEELDLETFRHTQREILKLVDGSDARSIQLKNSLTRKINDPMAFLAAAMVAVIGFDNRCASETLLLKKDSGTLFWKIANILDIGFHNRKKANPLIVIPVNCQFDTHVTRTYENAPMQCVSEKTIHGQWLTRMQHAGTTEKQLATRIENALMRQFGEPRRSGYPIGTIVPIDQTNATFVLLAVSSFDEQGIARSTKDNIDKAVRELLRFYEEAGQGTDIYLPLIGSGLSKSGLRKEESLALIKRSVANSPYYLGGKMTIAMRSVDAREIGLIS